MNKTHIINLYTLILSDNMVEKSEMKILYEIGSEQGFTKKEVDELIRNPHKIKHIKPNNEKLKLEYLLDYCRLIEADENTDPREILFCKDLADKLGFNDENIVHNLIEFFIDEIRDRKHKINVKELVQAAIDSGLTQHTLSRIKIDEKYKITLLDYNEMKIEMSTLAKTLYLFFINHPEGIELKKLVEHKNELLNIYQNISNRENVSSIQQSIEELIDVRKTSINENLSRIKKAFKDKIKNDHIARFYYVNGIRGGTYSISLDRILLI